MGLGAGEILMQFNDNGDNCDDDDDDDDQDDDDGHLLGVVGGCHCNVKMISGPLLPSDCKRLFLQVSLLTCTYLLFCFSKIEMARFQCLNVTMLYFAAGGLKFFFFSRQID